MSGVPNRSQIKKGKHVSIETKENQRTGKLTEGIVEDILTASESHPHGIKVRLQSGQVGRVKEIKDSDTVIISENEKKSQRAHKAWETHRTKTAKDSEKINHADEFEDLEHKVIPKTEDKHNEFKEFYQYDNMMGKLLVDLTDAKNIIIKKKKQEVQQRFATAICAFGNKDGGFVYLGVQADGTVTGLEKDKALENFADYTDEFANHIQSRLNGLIKDDAFILSKLNMLFRQIGEKTICIIQILPSNRPLYLHSDRGNEFYVRGIAPRANKLNGMDEARYIKVRFPNL